MLLAAPAYAYVITTGNFNANDPNQDTPFGSNEGSCCGKFNAQQFTTTAGGFVSEIVAQTWQRGNPSGLLVATLNASAGGSPANPTNVAIATSTATGTTGTFATGGFGQPSTFVFMPPVYLQPNTTYFFTLQATIFGVASNIYWGQGALDAATTPMRTYFLGSFHSETAAVGAHIIVNTPDFWFPF